MTTEQEFLHRLEAADALQLAEIISSATAEQEQLLRVYLGDERFRRMRDRVAGANLTRGRRSVSGNVVVIHGIMGAELSSYKQKSADLVWVSIPRIVTGCLERLQLAPDGLTEATSGWTVRASGILKRYYGNLLLWLAGEWNVKPFFFDWRKSLDLAANDLNDRINEWFPGQPAHIVAHSMGGLVARTFIANHGESWKRMWDEPGAGRRGGRLVMLGTPNHGSFAIPQVITGLEPLVQKLSKADLHHDVRELQQIFNTFPGSLQMLPSPLKYDSLRPLYRAETYGALGISQAHLNAALDHHMKLSTVIERDRMVYVAGFNQPTFSYVDPKLPAMSKLGAYTVTREGDGRVPHKLGLLDNVTSYYVETDHGGLSEKERVFEIIESLLDLGRSSVAPTELPAFAAARGGDKLAAQDQQALRDEIRRQASSDGEQISALTARHAGRGSAAAATAPVSDEDRRAEELVFRGLMGSGTGARANTAPAVVTAGTAPVAPAPSPASVVATIVVRLTPGSIVDVDGLAAGGPPVDAVSVGHYIGVPPVAAEKTIDDALLAASGGASGGRSRGVIAQFTERGILRGGLGEPFFINDPRPRGKNGHRLITVLGLGEPGRLGSPELVIAVRELCWSLGRLGKRHLATVLIGAGPGNLPIPDAVNAWMRGVRRALIETGGSDGPRRKDATKSLQRITFVEWDPSRIAGIAEALKAEVDRQRKTGLKIQLALPTASEQKRWAAERRRPQRNREDRNGDNGANRTPTVVTVSQSKEGYVFAALTEKASVPERIVAVDHALALEANERLAGAGDTAQQRSLGRTLMNLVVPTELRNHLRSSAPVVMVVDATTARLHWEMMADGEPDSDADDAFLATGRGFTRQLRTSFASLPEPPPPPARTLRVLVVADPARDKRLPGAALEGIEVAKLFNQFNRIHGASEQRVSVTTLFGPDQATRLNVLIALTEQNFDVMHFAGHCAFDETDSANSGWIFSEGMRLRARELNRLDKIPRFIFSNACESGITPERASARSVAAAPSFAESFFERGVTNFVCTAWGVNDDAALTFALSLYRELLGLQDDKPSTPGRFATMAEALKAARAAIIGQGGGGRTWGAYQHYGSPFYRFFDAAVNAAKPVKVSPPRPRAGRPRKASEKRT